MLSVRSICGSKARSLPPSFVGHMPGREVRRRSRQQGCQSQRVPAYTPSTKIVFCGRARVAKAVSKIEAHHVPPWCPCAAAQYQCSRTSTPRPQSRSPNVNRPRELVEERARLKPPHARMPILRAVVERVGILVHGVQMAIESRGCWSRRASIPRSSPSSKSRMANESAVRLHVTPLTRQRADVAGVRAGGSPIEPSGSGTVSDVVLKARTGEVQDRRRDKPKVSQVH